ncbi:MAG: DUF1330 domain-containing protein [Janthinobacterium lividum]
MTAYVIGEVEIRQPEQMVGYAEKVAQAVAQYGGRYLARGTKPEVLEGGPAHKILMIEFPNVEAAHAWYGSPEYAEAHAIRRGHSDLRLIIVDGVNALKPQP